MTDTTVYLAWSYYGDPIVEGVYASAEGAARKVNAVFEKMVGDRDEATKVGTLMDEDGTELVTRYDTPKGGAWVEKRDVED
jgi:hypothetical protein